MKFFGTQIGYLMTRGEARRDLRALLKYLAFLSAVVLVYAVLFHVIMAWEGQKHSWLTGVYWTLTVMSTLGFGDITFHSDLGRMFSILVLLSGIVLLLIVLPFAFIRFFYAPWLEAQMRAGAPREVPEDTRGHVIIAAYDALGARLVKRLKDLHVPVWVIEPDPTRATALHHEGVPVVSGDVDSRDLYELMRAPEAAMVVANIDDATNTNIILTVREVCPDVRIVATANDKDAVDVLELSGATAVLPLRHILGEYLASRVSVGTAHAFVVGHFHDLVIAEFPVHGTPFAGKTVRECRMRELTGLSIVALWERGEVKGALPASVMGEHSVAVVVGTEKQLTALEATLVIYQPNDEPVVVIGGGKVGRATARALKRRNLRVHIVERNPELRAPLSEIADRVVIGDADEIGIVTEAGVKVAPSIVLTTNDDATNVFLGVYCRKLNPDARIVSRITHPRNLEAIHRAGADLVLSDTYLGTKAIVAMLQGRELTIMEEGLDLFVLDVPSALTGKTIAESEIGAKTGLSVIAVQADGEMATSPSATTELRAGTELVMIGSAQQKEAFDQTFA